MHIMEGFLPHPWWEIWWAIMIPIVAYGIYSLSKIARKNPEAKPLLALMGAFIFVVSALKLPSVFGSSSHPTGSGLAAVVFGPAIASVLSMIALIFQATLLAHGGITTLGANVFSMGIVGPAVAYVNMDFMQKNSCTNSSSRISCRSLKRPSSPISQPHSSWLWLSLQQASHKRFCSLPAYSQSHKYRLQSPKASLPFSSLSSSLNTKAKS